MSLSVVELTLTAVETQAGKLIAFVALPVPAAARWSGIPTERRLSMTSLMGSPSQEEVAGPPLTFRLVAAKG